MTPAQTNHALRQRPDQRPAGNIHFMHALIADVPIAEIPEPVPVVMDEVPMKRPLGRRAKPEIEIKVGRRRLDGFESDAPARFAAVAFRNEQPAVLAALNQRRKRRTAAGAALRAMLNHAVVLARGLDTLRPFEHVMAAGFLDVHVLSRLAGQMVIRECQWFGVAMEIASTS